MSKVPVLEHLKNSIESVKAFAGSPFSELAQITVEAIEEQDRVKADKVEKVGITIPASGWASDEGLSGYLEYYDIPAAGVTGKDRVEIMIAPESLDVAKACGLCPTSQTFVGKIRIRAARVPETAITAEYWIDVGKE